MGGCCGCRFPDRIRISLVIQTRPALADKSDSHTSACVVLFVIAAVFRLGYLIAKRPTFDSLYWLLATSILHDGSMTIAGEPSADFEPLYPLFLAASRLFTLSHPLGTQVLQVLVASLGTVFAFRLALALTHKPRIAMFTAGLFACHPLLVRQASIASDLWLATTLVVAFAHSFVRATSVGSFAISGLALGLALLTRSISLPLLALAPAVLLVRNRSAEAAALALVASLLFAPFAIRNRLITGSWDPTRSGLNLFVGNSPFTDVLLPEHDLDLLEDRAEALVKQQGWSSEEMDSLEYAVAANRLLTTSAWDHVINNPVEAAGRIARKTIYFFWPVVIPKYVVNDGTHLVVDDEGKIAVRNASRRPILEILAYSFFSVPVLLASTAGIYLRRRDWRHDAILWCILVTFAGMHSIYFPATRYSAPMTVVLLFYAAVAADALRGRIARPFLDPF